MLGRLPSPFKASIQMTTLVYAITGVAVLLGVGVAIWSVIDTRKRHYEDYVSRKQNDK